MNPRHVLLSAVLASACLLAPSVHAAGHGGNGHDGSAQGQAHGSLHAGDAGSASQGYADGNLPATQQVTPSRAGTTTGNAGSDSSSCGDGASSVGTLIGDCSSSHGADAGGSTDNGDANLGWQSLLPGSIQ